jgi:hypothetical protein
MTTFLYAYRMPTDYKPGRPDAKKAWSAFFDGLGSHLVDPGNPVFESVPVGTCGSGPVRLGGFSLVTADDLDAAVTMTEGCPILEEGGGVEVGVITEIYPDRRLTVEG